MKRRPYEPKTGKIEREYGRALRKIARHVGDIIGVFAPGDPAADSVIGRALDDYAALLGTWAHATAGRMLAGVMREDDAAWRARSVEMSSALRDEIRNAPTGALMRQLLEEQVGLIKSIPLNAAQRVHDWTLVGIEDATRAGEVAAQIRRSNDVAASRAMLIARTEVSRTSSKLTEARAVHVGSEGYIWRTSRDSDVRDSHREMEGKYVPWHTPPTLSDGTTTHAGQIYNCRCYPEPVIPD
jgi:SPP1 gp7 family putative phage head morphogenesis protein